MPQLHSGKLPTTQWESVHYTVGSCQLHSGKVFITQWGSVHYTVGKYSLHSGKISLHTGENFIIYLRKRKFNGMQNINIKKEIL